MDQVDRKWDVKRCEVLDVDFGPRDVEPITFAGSTFVLGSIVEIDEYVSSGTGGEGLIAGLKQHVCAILNDLLHFGVGLGILLIAAAAVAVSRIK